MSDARRAVDRLKDAYNSHDLEALAQCFTERPVLVSPDGIAEDKEEIASYYGQFMQAFPDTIVTPQSVTGSEDTLVAEFTITGTHKGPFLVPGGGILEATGRPIAIGACSVSIVEERLILSHRIYYDQLELVTQLGGLACFSDHPL
ncbi:ester cyclase [Sphaerisporangium corydalis]|uniref:Ester cyclase n=1 Tax=Sphaerisporangium corydalis TaxID=1441875 RepID=A0ABV9EAR2_9ACTN|nr:ester cyclase [Sphaerisporangium corydalis]